MKAEEIFENSVKVMKGLLSKSEMLASIKRAKERDENQNEKLLIKERQNINELVRKIAEADGSGQTMRGVPDDLVDAMVIRYLKNREVFMKTFPDGIEDIDADPVSIWAAIMISPHDEKPF
ncbi:MAG: hypothetical protein AB1632_03910 [Nitrospirota bacterium]